MRRSITEARYNMRATILRPLDPKTNDPIDPNDVGQYVNQQDPLTGETIQVWQPVPKDNPNTPADESFLVTDIRCMARGIADGGIRAAATTENFGDVYMNVDIINMWVPLKYRITKRDRVTNIRDAKGRILWRDEELEETTDQKATVFNVNGVIPQLDYRNTPIAQFCLLERAEV